MNERVLLLADIHANLSALNAVLTDARRRYDGHGGMTTWFVGDLFGRGPDPIEVWGRLNGLRLEVCVSGNHDWGVIGRLNAVDLGRVQDGEFNANTDWPVILAHRSELQSAGLLECDTSHGLPIAGEIMDQVGGWPLAQTPRAGVYVIHGGADRALNWHGRDWSLSANLLHNVWGYVKRPQDVSFTMDVLHWLAGVPAAQLELGLQGDCQTPAVVIVGHFHRRRLAKIQLDAVQWESPIRLDVPYPLSPVADAPVLISPGSVGFPYEETDGACYAVLEMVDSCITAVTFHAATYDVDLVRRSMMAKGYPREVVNLLRLRRIEEAEI